MPHHPGTGPARLDPHSGAQAFGGPQVVHRPGLATDMLRELAPLLAAEGIQVTDGQIDAPGVDLPGLQAALNRAVERRNLELFTPVGPDRDRAVGVLSAAVPAVAAGDPTGVADVLAQVRPESPDGAAATVSACIGLSLGLLDRWLSGDDANVPAGLARRVQLPPGRWAGERAALDILALAGKGCAFRSLDTLIGRQGGELVLHGSALALGATITTWARETGTPVPDLTRFALL